MFILIYIYIYVLIKFDKNADCIPIVHSYQTVKLEAKQSMTLSLPLTVECWEIFFISNICSGYTSTSLVQQ